MEDGWKAPSFGQQLSWDMHGGWKTTCRSQLPPSTMWVSGCRNQALWKVSLLVDLSLWPNLLFILIRRSRSSWMWAFVVEKLVLQCQNQLPKSQFNFPPHCVLSTAHCSHHLQVLSCSFTHLLCRANPPLSPHWLCTVIRAHPHNLFHENHLVNALKTVNSYETHTPTSGLRRFKGVPAILFIFFFTA